MSKRVPIRHGEVLLLPVSDIPPGKVSKVRECIIGHSETGHHHVLEADKPFDQVIGPDGKMYVDLNLPVPLRHHKEFQQHRELMVPEGRWLIVRKMEYAPYTGPQSEPFMQEVSD